MSDNGQDDKNYLIEQLSKFIEEQARMRFQQQIHQHHQKHAMPQEITGPGFSFVLPPLTKADFNKESDEPIQFAVQPFDSRYYETTEGEEVVDDFEPNPMSLESDPPAEAKNQILIPPPMHIKDVLESGTTDKILHRAQQKLARSQQAPDVMQKPMQVEYDNTMSLYIVALIAGLSCAFSTGVSSISSCSHAKRLKTFFSLLQLIALGIMYWTLYKKSKSGEFSLFYNVQCGIERNLL